MVFDKSVLQLVITVKKETWSPTLNSTISFIAVEEVLIFF